MGGLLLAFEVNRTARIAVVSLGGCLINLLVYFLSQFCMVRQFPAFHFPADVLRHQPLRRTDYG